MSTGRLLWIRLVLGAYWAAMVIGSHWPRLNMAGQFHLQESYLLLPIDKLMHCGAYAGLAWLVMAARLFGARTGMVLAAGVLAGHAAADELTQWFVSGRTVQFADWVASATGIGVGLSAWGLTRWVFGGRVDVLGFVGHMRQISALTVVSRAFGLVRDRVLAWAFGFGGVMDAFVIAFMIPNLFRRLFGEGALAAAFIPQYTRLRNGNGEAAEDAGDGATEAADEEAQQADEAARGLARLVLGLLTAVLMAVAVVGVLVLTGLLWSGTLDERGALTVRLTLVTLWYMPLVCIAAVLGAILQVHGRFVVPAASPIVLNVCIIGSAWAGAAWLGEAWPLGRQMMVVAGAVVLGGVAQVAWHRWALWRRGVRLGGNRPWWAVWRTDPSARTGLRRLLGQWGPTVLGLAAFQLNVLVDGLIALLFSGPADEAVGLLGIDWAYPMEVGSVAVLGMAQRLYEFPLGVFGIALATAIFPRLAAAGRSNERGLMEDRSGRFAALLREGLRLTVFIGLPASVGLWLVREPLATAIYFAGGRLETGDAARVAWVLGGYAPAVWAYSINQVLTRAFYARDDARTPMRVTLAMVGVNVALNLVLIWPLGAAGLAWSTAVCAALRCAVLLGLIRRHAERPIDAAVLRSWARTAVLTTLMAAAVWGLIGRVELPGLGWPEVLGVLGLGVVSGAAVIAVGARLWGMAELRWLIRGNTGTDGGGEAAEPPVGAGTGRETDRLNDE